MPAQSRESRLCHAVARRQYLYRMAQECEHMMTSGVLVGQAQKWGCLYDQQPRQPQQEEGQEVLELLEWRQEV